MPLAFLQLGAPWMLMGGLLAAMPIISHLMHRRTRRRIVWPTVRLLAESSASQSNLFKLRRLVLLILRCLAILLIAGAFARPVWLNGAAGGHGESGATVVMIMDVSASAGQQSSGVPLVNRMRAVAGRTLNSLQEGRDQVNLVYATAQPAAALPQPTYNFTLIREELDKLAATHERADLIKALALGGKILRAHEGQKQLVIFSDLQRSNWSEILSGSAAGFGLGEDVQVTLVPIEGVAESNASISRPRVQPVQPVVGRPAQLIVQVSNFAPEAREIEVSATVENRRLGKQRIKLPAGGMGEVSFQTTFTEEGPRRVRFSLPPDEMTDDDAAYLVVRPVRRVPIVIVGDDDPHLPGTATYFLLRSLAPRGDMSDPLRVIHLAAGDLNFGRISDAEAVLISYVGRLSEKAVEDLHAYVNQGGGVLMLCDGGAVADNLRAFEKLGKGRSIVPWLPTRHRNLAAAGGFLTISAGAWASPLLKDFDVPSREALGRIRFGRVWRTTDLAPDAAALLTYDDGTPALSERRIGAGRLLLANFSPALTGSDLGKYGTFVALMQSTVSYLRPRQDFRAGATAGLPCAFATASLSDRAKPEDFSVVGPNQKPTVATLTLDGGRMLVAISQPRLPGFYALVRGNEPAVEVTAVNVDPAESDLRRVSAAAAAKALQSSVASVAVRGSGAEGPILHVRGEPLWPWFVVAALAVLGLELLVLCIWKR